MMIKEMRHRRAESALHPIAPRPEHVSSLPRALSCARAVPWPPGRQIAPAVRVNGQMRPEMHAADHAPTCYNPDSAPVVGEKFAFSHDCRKSLDWHARDVEAAAREADRRSSTRPARLERTVLCMTMPPSGYRARAS